MGVAVIAFPGSPDVGMDLDDVDVVVDMPVDFLLGDGGAVIRQKDLELDVLLGGGIQGHQAEKGIHGVAAGAGRFDVLPGNEVFRMFVAVE